ncbi:MAG TPA: ORF6N domain-containing protein [Pedobacter sp.]|uniref:ORF6N domain-containing protein n=1 Tax=Pedobacter sp. TaxID=1411316 RepID=UPI002B6464F2|nr:ORF6N domain-containing protein [Pedobacter sp.]HMI03360.1 ORF6N domain-containing protein [Pedobacter sp.]
MTEIQKVLDMEGIRTKIYNIRGTQVMMDRDLAELYNVEMKVLHQTVRRNLERFADDFMFQLTREELASLKSGMGGSSREGSDKLSFAFSEAGVGMLSVVLHSDIAVRINLRIVEAVCEQVQLFG